MDTTPRDIAANGLTFRVFEAGESNDGGLVLCLHGFPELAHSYRHQIPVLVDAGYRVWAPDLRGYGGTDRPTRMADYAIERLVDDVAGLIDAAGVERAIVIAHDWGGLIAWHFAMRRPDKLERLVMLNMPHPALYNREVRKLGEQFRGSWYVLAFQIPGLAERLLAANSHHAIEAAFVSAAVNKDRFTERDLTLYREAAAQPGALTAMLNYYRAYVLQGGRLRQQALGYPVIEAPTLLIYGERDTALLKETIIGTDEQVEDLTVRYLPDASHWVQQDDPDSVNAILAAWLAGREVPQVWEL